ncbi:MAG: HEAT repeat domain-containing protein [Anaerolineae bacterium]|nr:HEAT repeat domain-containing protein [Anaerolineae bacterium]
MEFNGQNFAAGLLAGWLSAYVIYRSRHQLKALREAAGQSAQNVQKSATRSADSRYISDLIERCETSHLAGQFTKLSSVLVEPRFLPAPEFASPSEDLAYNIYRVVPTIHDHPYLHAPYQVQTLSINDLALGDHAIALLGLPGSGRSTALQAIALHALNKIRFEPPPDKVQAKLDAAEAALAEKERAVRIKERVLIEQKAKERLANEQGENYEAAADEQVKNIIPLFRRLMPLYLHLSDLHLQSPEHGQEADPAELIVRAVQHTVRRVTASTIPRQLYSRLNKGQVLLLIDGYDDLPEAERPAALAWLQGMLQEYKHNFFIVVGPAEGYGSLTNLGFTPVFMRPWSDLDLERGTERWAEGWVQTARKMGNRRASKPTEEQMAIARKNGRALSTVEATLKIWGTYADDTETIGAEGWIRAYLKRHKVTAELIQQIAPLAALQLDEGYITVARLQALALGTTELGGAPTDDAIPEPELEAPPVAPAKGKRGKSKDGEAEDEAETTVQGRLLTTLKRSGVLFHWKGNRYTFRSPIIAAYLASLTLKPEDVPAKLNSPAWQPALAFSALHVKLDRIVAERMKATPDLLNDNVIDMARWLAYAPPDVQWRGPLIKQLGTMLTQPNQYPHTRERAAAALIDGRDRNTLVAFRLAVRSADPTVRRLGCLGLGALAEPEGQKDLLPLLNDQEEDVQLSAGMGLGAIGTEEALSAMVEAFVAGTEPLRRAMAEAFAALPHDGYEIIYEGANSDDMLLRRAAIFGLRRIRTTWALIAIYRAFLEDEQWYVRSAAQEAFQEIQYGKVTNPTVGYPSPETIEWLQEWAAEKGEQIQTSDAAIQMLLRALQEGEPGIKQLAALDLGQLGFVTNIKALYTALRDGRDDVRGAAHRALAYFQQTLGEKLPSAI